MKPMKILTLLVTVLMLLSIVTGCSSSVATTAATTKAATTAAATTAAATSAAQAKKDYQIGVTLPTMSTPWCQELVRGINEAVDKYNKEKGTNVKLNILDNNRDAQKEVNNMEDLITRKMDAVLMISNDPKTSTLALETVIASKIPVVIVDSPCNGSEKANAVVVSDNYELGRLEMEMLAKGMGGKGNLIVFEDSTNTNSRIRAEGRDAELKKYPDIKILTKHDGPYAVDKAMEVMQNFMQAYPTQINAVWTFSDTPAQGVTAALAGTPLEKKILVAGLNGSDIAKGLIAEGKMFGTAAQFPRVLMSEGFLIAMDILNGKQPKEQRKLVAGAWICKENLAQYPIAPTTK